MKNFLTLLVIFILLSNMASSQSFIPHRLTYGSLTSQVTLADVDGDNDLDLLAAYPGDNLLAWYSNDGNGYFDSLHIIDDSEEERFYALFATDIDQDGNVGILLFKPALRSIFIYIQCRLYYTMV